MFEFGASHTRDQILHTHSCQLERHKGISRFHTDYWIDAFVEG